MTTQSRIPHADSLQDAKDAAVQLATSIACLKKEELEEFKAFVAARATNFDELLPIRDEYRRLFRSLAL